MNEIDYKDIIIINKEIEIIDDFLIKCIPSKIIPNEVYTILNLNIEDNKELYTNKKFIFINTKISNSVRAFFKFTN